jgi:hypothetical protein
MRKIREILRCYHEMGVSRRQIAEGLQAAHSAVGDVIRRANGAGLGWPIADFMTWDDGSIAGCVQISRAAGRATLCLRRSVVRGANKRRYLSHIG